MAGMWGTAARFAAFALACAVGLVFLANTMANRVGGDVARYQADFTNVSGLRPGDDVRVAGVRVGSVDSVELVNGRGRVAFTVDRDQPVTDSMRLTLRYQSLLGQRYLAILPGQTTGSRLGDDAVIPTSRTNPGFDLTALLNGFEPLFATLKPAQINQLAESIVAVLQGEGGTIESLVEQTATLTNRLADDSMLIRTIVTELTPVLADVAGQSDNVDEAISSLRALMGKLAKEHKHIGASLDGVSKLSTSTADLLDETRPSLAHDIHSLREFSRISVEQRQAIELFFATIPNLSQTFARPFSTGTWLEMYICNMAVEMGGNTIELSPNPNYSAGCD